MLSFRHTLDVCHVFLSVTQSLHPSCPSFLYVIDLILQSLRLVGWQHKLMMQRNVRYLWEDEIRELRPDPSVFVPLTQ